MRLRTSPILAVMLALGMLPAARAARANDLLKIYRQALNQDKTLQAAQHARDAAVEARPQALSAFLPQLSGTASIQREEQQYLSTSSQFLRAGQTFYNTNRSLQVTLSQTVWSFQSYRQLREADAQVAAAENTYLQARQTLIFNVAQAYFNVLSAADTVRADRAQLKANQALLDQAQHEYKAGLVAITNVQTAQASYDSTRATLVGDRAALANAKQSLAVLTGDYRPQVQPLLDDIPLVRPDPASPDSWVAAARKDNFDLRGAQLTYEIAKRDVSVKRSQYYPSLQIQGSASDSASGGQLGSHTRDYAIGLALNIPIFQGGLVQSQVRQAKATALEDQANLQGSQRSVSAQVRNAYDNVIAGISSVRSFRAAVASNRTALKATQMGLKVGTQTEIDVLTALNNLFTAQRQFYQARYTYLENLLTLKQLAGRLDVGDLRAIDALLVDNRGLTAPDPQMKVPIEHRLKPLGPSGGGAKQ